LQEARIFTDFCYIFKISTSILGIHVL